MGMTETEKKIMNLITEAHNHYTTLPPTHPSDILEWVTHIHGLQKMLALRVVRRDCKEDGWYSPIEND